MTTEDRSQAAPSSSEQSGCVPEFARHVHNYLQEFVRSSDQKAAFLLLAGTALFGVIYKEQSSSECLNWLKLVGMVLVLLSVGLSVWAVMPRQQRVNSGLISWEGILADRTPYRDRVLGQSPEQLKAEVLDHCVKLAKILHKKYQILHVALWLFLIGGTLAATFLLVSSWHHPVPTGR